MLYLIAMILKTTGGIMEVYEKLTSILKERGISKKEFALRLIDKDIKLKNTGEVPSEKVIYAYLSGRISLRIELIPSISEILNIVEQELFDDTETKHIKLLHHILRNPSELEYQTASILIRQENQPESHSFPEDYQLGRIQELLSYAPLRSVEKIITILERYKSMFEAFEKENI